MTASDLTFPVICIYKGTIFTSSTLDALTQTTTAAINGGLFDGLQIVDSSGKIYTVKSVKKLHGIGPFCGFNIFLNRTVRVKIEFEDGHETLGVDDVRRIVIGDFQRWQGWQTREDFDQLKTSVEKASTVAEIIRLICT